MLEKRDRDARNFTARTKSATLGRVKPLDRFDWAHPSSIERELFEERYETLGFMERGKNILFRGQAGVGKSTLAKHLGLALFAQHCHVFDIDADSWREKERKEGLDKKHALKKR